MPAKRQEMLTNIKRDGAFDVIVVGGGVNGIGVYRDLALQGLRVLLIERNDFASGCSAAPSRMIHGGLRYLENGEYDLVRESLAERDRLLRNAPHMVRPIPTLIPITSVFSGLLNGAASYFGRSGKPSNRGALPIKIGLTLYDWVTRKRRALQRHHFNSRKTTRVDWPELTPKARFSAIYHDAWISHPERLCIEMIADIEASGSDSIALNYSVLSVENGAHFVTCLRSGARLPVSGRAIVNATGAWLDETSKTLSATPGEQMVSGTKGSHLVINNAKLKSALNAHMVYFENADGRVCIVFEYQGNVLAGSTDIRVDAPTQVRCEADEQDYILASLKLVFPKLDVAQDEVVYSYSGIRPLPKSDQDFTGRISRGHYTKRVDGNPPQFCMVGGKWTTFRAFAEQTADEVLAELSHARRCSTADMAIGGGVGFVAQSESLVRTLVTTYAISTERAAHLVAHYGSNAPAIMAYCSAQENDAPLYEGAHYSTSEIDFLIANEYVETLADVVLRRSSLAITGKVSVDVINSIADRMAAVRNLSDAEIALQISALTQTLSKFHGVSLAILEERSNGRRIKCA